RAGAPIRRSVISLAAHHQPRQGQATMLSSSRVVLAIFLVGCGAAQTSEPKPSPPVPPPSVASSIGDAAPPPREDGRLPPGVKPTHYALDLIVDPSKPTFTGRARIGVVIDTPTRSIVLHGRG